MKEAAEVLQDEKNRTARLHIAIVSNLYPPLIRGGAEISTKLLAQALEQLGHRISIITSKEAAELAQDKEVIGVRAKRPYFAHTSERHSLTARILWHTAESMSFGPKEIVKVLSTIRPDAILTQNLTGLGSRILQRIKEAVGPDVPVVHTLRDYGLMCIKNSLYHSAGNPCPPFSLCSFRSALAMQSTKSIDGVVGISKHVLNRHLTSGFFPNAVPHVIQNGIDASGRVQSIPLENRAFAFGYVGRIADEKGVFSLVEAYRKAKRSNPDLGPLAIAGDGDTRDINQLLRLISGLPVTYVGSVQPYEFFGKCATAIIPSKWEEPFGRVVIEAASMGCQLIVADRGGLLEAVEVAGGAEFASSCASINPTDIEAFAGTLANWKLKPIPSVPFTQRSGSDVAKEYINIINDIRAARHS